MGSAPSAQPCSDSGLKLFQDQKGKNMVGKCLLRFGVVSTVHVSLYLPGTSSSFILCDLQLELHEKCMSKQGGEMYNFQKGSASHLHKKNIINVKYPLGKELEKCGGKGKKQVSLKKQPDSVWTVPHPAPVGQ